MEVWIGDPFLTERTLLPTLISAMERDLAHEALAPVAAWFDANIPQEIRDTAGGEIQ